MINIENILNQYLQKENEAQKKEHSEYSGLISASILGQCHRRQFYSINKIEPTNPPDERALRVFSCGNVFHKFIQDIAKEKEKIEIEKVFKDDNFSVRADIVTEDAVYELKSMHSRGFWHMDKELKSGKKITEIKKEHWLQVGLCASLFKKENACLVYISKDDLCIKQINIKTSEIEKDVSEEVCLVQKVIDYGLLPEPLPRLYGKDKDGKPKECEYCNWKDRCKTEREV